MKKVVLMLTFSLLVIFVSQGQSANTRKNRGDENYTGKRYDSYGRALEKQNKRRKVENKDEVFQGSIRKKSYPIGMDKDKKKERKKKKKLRQARKGKACDCPGK